MSSVPDISGDEMSLELGRLQALAQATLHRADGAAPADALWLIDLIVVDLLRLKMNVDAGAFPSAKTVRHQRSTIEDRPQLDGSG